MGLLKAGANYRITSNFDKNMVFDLYGQAVANDKIVGSYPWKKLNNQLWSVDEIKPDIYSFHPKTNKNFSIDDNNGKLLIWTKHGGDNQKFKLVPVSTGSNIFYIESITRHDVVQFIPNEGVKLPFAKKEEGNLKQQWIFEEIDDKFNVVPKGKRKFIPVYRIIGENGEDEGFVGMDEIGEYLADINYQKKK